MPGKKPDFRVNVRHADDEQGFGVVVGAAWKFQTKNGTTGVNVKLQAPLTLGPDWSLTLWPDKGRQKPAQESVAAAPEDDDDIPF